MESGTVYLNGQQRRLVHLSEEKKVYVGQGIAGVGRFIRIQKGVVLDQIDQRHMNSAAHSGEFWLLENRFNHGVEQIF